MTKIETAQDARNMILQAIEFAGHEEVLATVAQYNNTTDNDISDRGDVWVSAPQTGHWLDEDQLVAFAKFLA